METELTIGEFSRASHLSVKTLRHYHEVGLLAPTSVDPGTGYRRYAVEQIPTAQVIRRLRDLQMPIAEVKAVVGAADARERNALIAAHLARLEGELERTRQVVGSVRDLIVGPPTPLDVQHRAAPPLPAIGIRETVDREDVLAWWQGAIGELRATVGAQGLRSTGPIGGLYAGGLYEHDRGEAVVFAPVDGQARAIGRVEALVVPAAELAVVMHHGSLVDIDVTYGALGAYVARHELSVEGPLRETYLRDADDTEDPDEWATEIGWPIFRAKG
ncbi:MAG TPA: MerR family transcriptional regulator [Solirubrobacterales bacterium]|nr:MerR family transcriptional regulator [Solirubrobacterales bacterium]